jgi:hypothetical protein
VSSGISTGWVGVFSGGMVALLGGVGFDISIGVSLIYGAFVCNSLIYRFLFVLCRDSIIISNIFAIKKKVCAT